MIIPLEDEDVKLHLLGKPTKSILVKLLECPDLCSHLTEEQKEKAIEIVLQIEGPIEPMVDRNTSHGWTWLSKRCWPKSIKVYKLR